MKRINIFIILILSSCLSLHAQNCLVLEYRNLVPGGCSGQSGDATFNSFTFEIWASAASCYTGSSGDWKAMVIRIDAGVGSTNIASVTNSFNPEYVMNGSGLTAVPGAPPAGQSELGLTFLRDTETDLTATPVRLSTITVNLTTPVSEAATVTTRGEATVSGSSYSNNESGQVRLSIASPATQTALSCSALPVTLMYFSVSRESEAALLQWETTEESNSSHFEIQQSHNGKIWNKIGQISAKGRSSIVSKYSFTDVSPLEGQNFYRLKMVDIDGSFAFTEIKSIAFPVVGSYVFPNPVTDRIYFRSFDKIREVVIYDTNGVQQYKGAVSPEGIAVSGLTAGIYLVTAHKTDGTSRSFKIAK